MVLVIGCGTAKELMEKGVIRGAYLAVQGRYRWISYQEPFPRPINFD
jgi:hypothetical protein